MAGPVTIRLFARIADRVTARFRLNIVLHAVTLVTAAGLCLMAGLTLRELRDDAVERAESSSGNILGLIERDVARNIELFDLSLAAVVDGLKLPGIAALTPDMRHAVLFDRSATAKYLGAVLVLNRDGNVVADSRSPVPRVANFYERDYFQHHVDHVDRGLYVSRPYTSSTNGETVIGLSRRLETADGTFDGVIVGTMQVSYFGDMFSPLNVGPHGTINLHRSDGLVLMRKPYVPGAIGTSLAGGVAFKRAAEQRRGTTTARSAIDGVERRITFTQIGDLPLYLFVALSTDDMFAEWWRKAVAIGAVVLCLGAVTAILNGLLLRELQRRRRVEDHLQAANEALERLALTDPLTGLCNRRRFDEILAHNWSWGQANAGRVALVMLDADHFKAYNDRYGHAGGDSVLRAIAADLKTACLGTEHEPCRVGGEEFALVLPGAGETAALALAERIRRLVEARRLVHAGSPLGLVTISVGAAVLAPRPGLEPRALLEAADAALYRAKADGRNRTRLLAGHAHHADLSDALVPIGVARRRRARAGA